MTSAVPAATAVRTAVVSLTFATVTTPVSELCQLTAWYVAFGGEMMTTNCFSVSEAVPSTTSETALPPASRMVRLVTGTALTVTAQVAVLL